VTTRTGLGDFHWTTALIVAAAILAWELHGLVSLIRWLWSR